MVQKAHLHEAHLPAIRHQPRQGLDRRRALERQQGARGEILDLDLFGDMGAQMRLIGLLAGGIDHQDQVIAGIGHHEIVEDAARFIGEEGIARAAGGKPGDIGGDDPLQRRREAAATRLRREAKLAHMGDVEQPRLAAGLQMLRQYAGGILHRHVIAGEGHHLGAELEMQIVERGAFQRRFDHHILQQIAAPRPGLAAWLRCPLCRRT